MRPLWRGAISFGLVNIPVGLYSAIARRPSVDFDLLRDSDHSRIRYRKVAEADGLEVPREHIVKGYEHEKGSYVEVTPKAFERVQMKSTQTVDIREFVDVSAIARDKLHGLQVGNLLRIKAFSCKHACAEPERTGSPRNLRM